MVMGRHYRELRVCRGGGRNQNTQAGTRVDMTLKDLPCGLMLPCRPTLLIFSLLWNSIARWGTKWSKHRLVVEYRFKSIYVPEDTVAILRMWCCWDRRLSTNRSPWERKEWSFLPGWVQCLGLVIIHASKGLLLPRDHSKSHTNDCSVLALLCAIWNSPQRPLRTPLVLGSPCWWKIAFFVPWLGFPSNAPPTPFLLYFCYVLNLMMQFITLSSPGLGFWLFTCLLFKSQQVHRFFFPLC